MASLNDTPRASRLHIAVFGKTNAGKSSLINRITGADTALVSEVAGTTTDPVYKSMELLPIGPVVLIDTAGLDDETELGRARIQKTREVMDKTDLAVVVIRSDDADPTAEKQYVDAFKKRKTPVVLVYNQFGDAQPPKDAIVVNALTGDGIDTLKQELIKNAGELESGTLIGDMVNPGDIVLLVMPQDPQAPKGRLILPQVQVLRDLLDHNCKAVCVQTNDMEDMLQNLKHPPALAITDSQVFHYVNEHLDKNIRLTSFSMLMAKQKGDIDEFSKGARAIASLKPGDRVLIAESCTHHAAKGDIAREKLPRWIDEFVGGKLEYTTASGHGFPEDIEQYQLIVQCGGCMVNRKNMLSKIHAAQQHGVPITNFGVAIAFLHGMLNRVE